MIKSFSLIWSIWLRVWSIVLVMINIIKGMINSFSYEYDQYIKIANKRITKAMSLCHKPEFSNT